MLSATVPLFLNHFDLSINPMFCHSEPYISFLIDLLQKIKIRKILGNHIQDHKVSWYL